jgi:hypothetical protein
MLKKIGNALSDARLWKALHLVGALLWLAAVPAAFLFSWWESVAFVVFASIYANFIGHWSAWQAARAEGQSEKPPKN